MTEQDVLRELVADIVEAEGPRGDNERLWSAFEGAGLFSVGIDEECGGSGGSLSDLVVLAQATAATGSAVPFVEFAIAQWILASSSAGTTGVERSTAVFLDIGGEALSTGTRTVEGVAGAHSVDTVVLCTSDGQYLALSTADKAVEISPGTNFSHGSSDTLTISADASVRALNCSLSPDSVLERFALLRAASLAGAIRRAYELTRDYVRDRQQFGAPLIALPAVASAVATMRTKVLESDAAIDAAIEDPTLFAAIAARVVTARAATESARLAHQLHGAMGTTIEYPLHTVTTALWVWRDADRPEVDWAYSLGETVVSGGESNTWDAMEGNLR